MYTFLFSVFQPITTTVLKIQGKVRHYSTLEYCNYYATVLGTTRLVCGNTPRDGKVEILRPSGWSPVCNQFWNIRDASVVCRQLSFPGVESVQLTSRQFSNCRNPKTYKASQVKCLGTEHNWQSCSVRVGYCHESQQVAIRCSSDGMFSVNVSSIHVSL